MNQFAPTFASTPFGILENRAYDSPTFAGKDPRQGWRTPLNNIKYSERRDEETDLSYFGARYYDSDLTTGWLSVGPMADKYPSMSPYNYCAGNPVKLVDPDGRDVLPTSEDAYQMILMTVLESAMGCREQ